jgi:hypothetical protein
MGKTVGIERVEVEHSNAETAGMLAPLRVLQRGYLYAAAAEAFHAVARAADDQQLVRTGVAFANDVHRKRLAVAPLHRMRFGLCLQACTRGRIQEAAAGLFVRG